MDDTPTLNDRVASEIRAWIGRRQTTGRKVAAKIGKSQTWVSTRTRGETEIAVNDLQLFAQALDVEVSALLPTGQRTSLPKPTVPDRAMRAAHLATAGCPNRPTPTAPNLTTPDTPIRRPVIRLGRQGGVTA